MTPPDRYAGLRGGCLAAAYRADVRWMERRILALYWTDDPEEQEEFDRLGAELEAAAREYGRRLKEVTR